MDSRLKSVAVAFLGAMLAVSIPAPASAYSSAPLTICNKTPDSMVVAIGYHSPGVNDPADHSVLTGPFVSRGWREIAPGECHDFSNPFGARYMFWFGWGKKNGGVDAEKLAESRTGTSEFCAGNFVTADGNVSGFTYESENTSETTCKQANGFWVAPLVVDTWVDPTVNFDKWVGPNTGQ
jgi:uncharacterized membrane protein